MTDPATETTTASWLVGLAIALATEGGVDDAAVADLLAEADGHQRALDGAYGRAVALLSEYPDDPTVHQAVELLARALRRFPRTVGAGQEE